MLSLRSWEGVALYGMEKIPAPLIEIAEKLWPISAFASREAWQAYVAKWLPKITK